MAGLLQFQYPVISLFGSFVSSAFNDTWHVSDGLTDRSCDSLRDGECILEIETFRFFYPAEDLGGDGDIGIETRQHRAGTCFFVMDP